MNSKISVEAPVSGRGQCGEVTPGSPGAAIIARNFDALAETEGSIVRLRQLVLGLALKGGLSDLHADHRSVHEETCLPAAWKVKPVGEIADCVLGKMLDKSKHRTGLKRPYLRNINVRWGTVDLSDLLEMFFEDDELERYCVCVGDVLICEGGEPGRAAVWKGPDGMLIQKAIHRVRPHAGTVVPEWIVMNLRYDTWAGRLDGLFTGATIKHFTGQALRGYAIPLPPLAEQKRIVARVDQLMALIDDLEAKQTKKRDHSTRFTKASLEALTSAESAEDFDVAWKRVVENFATTIDRASKVSQIRRALLELAIRGLLTRESDGDRPLPIADQTAGCRTPFAIRGTWRWARLEQLCERITKGSSPKWQGVAYTDGAKDGILFVTSENVGPGRMLLDSPKYVESKFNTIEPRSILRQGDLLMNIVGASIGRAAIYDRSETANINQAVCLIRLLAGGMVDPEFLLRFFNSPTCTGFMFDKQVDNARANLSMGNIGKFLVPLPPLAEQKRIVAKVEHLMKLCDELEAKLRLAEDRASKLVEAVVQELVA